MDDILRAAAAKRGSPFLTTDEVAAYLGFARQSLDRMRRTGRGPPYVKHGRNVRYLAEDVHAWSEAGRRTPVRTPPASQKQTPRG